MERQKTEKESKLQREREAIQKKKSEKKKQKDRSERGQKDAQDKTLKDPMTAKPEEKNGNTNTGQRVQENEKEENNHHITYTKHLR